MVDNRPNPETLLKQVQEEEGKDRKGKLKIFFGYAAGVGKTYAMLQSAHMAKNAGIDVAAGYIEPHARPETMILTDGLEQIPCLVLEYKGIKLREFNLDAAIERHPQLVLVDELAHTNSNGCRHTKRYQDIQELLKAGIDVYTTINVQHLESLADIVASITGVMVKERIPDFIFDQADQVELVDIEPEELLERLKEGKIYKKKQAGQAMGHFFSLENLTALRELALRRTADQVNRIAEQKRRFNRERQYFTGEHILICISASPSNEKVIRAAARMASAFRAKFTAVYVDNPDTDDDEADTRRLKMNLHLAEQLGAKPVTLYGGDVSSQIAEYARVSGVSKIVLGRSYTKRGIFAKREGFPEQLTGIMQNTEVYLIPDQYEKTYRRKKRKKKVQISTMAHDLTMMIGITSLVTIASSIFRKFGFDESNIVTIYIFGVLLTAFVTENQIYNMAAAVLSVLCFNFFFAAPYYSLRVENPSYLITFFIMFLSAFMTGTLAKKVKIYGKEAVKKSYRTEILLETSQKLQGAEDKEQIARELGTQLGRLLQKDIVFYPGDPADEKLKTLDFPVEGETHIQDLHQDDETAVASWSYKNNKHAGATTNTLPGASGLYLAVRNDTMVYGVVGIYLGKNGLDTFDLSLLNAMLNEAGMAFGNALKGEKE